MSFAKYMSKTIGKNISKNVSSKHGQKLLDHTKQPAADSPKTGPKRVMQKAAEATADLIGNNIANKIKKISRTSPQNTSEAVTNETKNIGLDREVSRKIHMSTEKTTIYN